MLKKIRNLSKQKKGFTLIELIVVIAILAILAAIAIPSLNGFAASSKLEADRRTAETIQNMVQVAFLKGDLVLLPSPTADVITITKTTGTAAYTFASTAGTSAVFGTKDFPNAGATPAQYLAIVGDLLKPTAKINGTNIVLSVTAKGEVTVTTPSGLTPDALPSPSPSPTPTP